MFLPTFSPTASTSDPVGGISCPPSPLQIPTGTWSIDPVHSTIGFGVKHLGVSTFRGTFKQAAGSIVSDDDAIRSIEGGVHVENLTTEEPALTGHLHSEDFFDAEEHPEITFRSTAIEAGDDGHLTVTGELDIRGVSRPVELDAEIEGVGDGADGARASASPRRARSTAPTGASSGTPRSPTAPSRSPSASP